MRNFTLARLKAIVAFVGAMLTTATLLDWGFPIPTWVTALASLLTAVAVYTVPNLEPKAQAETHDEEPLAGDYTPRRAFDE